MWTAVNRRDFKSKITLLTSGQVLIDFSGAKSNYDNTHRMTKWADRLIVCTAALTAIVLIVDAALSIASGMYLNLGTGVWLGLARDTYDGVFYRPLWSGGEYGGTRYFPMLFVLTAGMMRTGLSAVSAGVLVSMLGLIAMATAVGLVLTRLGVSRALIVGGTALAIAPYFVHQTAFAVRCEPIAAAFAIFGLAAITPIATRASSTKRLLFAALLFVAAFMTKVTCVYAPAAATLALLLAGRRGEAIKLAASTIVGGIALVALVNALSEGRALESFRACALAGSSFRSLFSVTAVTRAVQLIATSHLLTVVFLLAITALAISRKDWYRLPALYLLMAAGVTAVIFTSPGTILTSQIVDAYVAAVVVLTTVIAGQTGRLQRAGYVVMIGLALWTAGQNGMRIASMIEQGTVRSGREAERQLIAAVNSCQRPMLSESAMVPIFAGQRPVLLDAFAFHVVALNRPEVEKDLVERLRRREFECVVLEQDPQTPRGRAWYSNVNLTSNVLQAVEQHYRLDRTVAGERFFRAVQ
jgi:hypothetical protein